VALRILGRQEEAANFVYSMAKKHKSDLDPEVVDKMYELLKNPRATLEDCLVWE
jgi:hypothetical protein